MTTIENPTTDRALATEQDRSGRPAGTPERPPAGPATPVAPAEVAGTGWFVPLLMLVIGIFMTLLDTSIVNVALPTMAKDYGSSTEDIEWVSTAYTLALGVVVPLSAWLSDRFGATRVYVWCLVAFAVTSVACGLAPNLESMIAFRVVQAIPGGIVPVMAMSMVMRIVPPEKMGIAMGVLGGGITLGPAAGPTLGGYLVDLDAWRWIFLINAPVGVLGAVAAAALLPALAPTSSRPFDWWGFGTIATSLFALLLAFTKANDWGWDSYRVLMLLTYGVLALALFVIIELESDHPLLELGALRYWQFVNSLLLVSALMIGLFVILFFLPLFLQTFQGKLALPTGLVLLPEALVMGVCMPVAGLLYDKVGPRWPIGVGLAVAAVGAFLLCGITPAMTSEDVIIWTSVRAVGNGLALMPIMTVGLASLPARYNSTGSALNNIAQRVATSLGLAALTSMASHQQEQLLADQTHLITPDRLPAPAAGPDLVYMYGLYQQLLAHTTAQSYSNVFLVCAGITVLGAGLGFLLRRPPPQDDSPAPTLMH